MVWPIVTKFGTMTHTDPLDPSNYSNMAACRNVYSGCIKYLFRNLSVIEFGQLDSEILYNDTQPKYKIAHITHFKIKQILTGEGGPWKLNLVVKHQILMVKTSQFTTKCNGDSILALKRNITLVGLHLDR